MGPGLPDGHREKPAVASKIARFFRVWAGRLTARAAPSNNSEQQTRHVQVSKDSFHSEPSTQDKADNRPLNRPHSKSSQPRFSRPYFSSIRAAAAGDDLPEHESQELTPHHVVLLAERDHAGGAPSPGCVPAIRRCCACSSPIRDGPTRRYRRPWACRSEASDRPEPERSSGCGKNSSGRARSPSRSTERERDGRQGRARSRRDRHPAPR